MLKSQDILILLKVHTFGKIDWSYSQLAQSLGMSASEAHAAVKRSGASGLYEPSTKKIKKQALIEFLIHGLKYVFYTQPGALSRGIPTAHSAEPLKHLLAADLQDVYVWPDPEGKVRGQRIEPLYKSVPIAVQQDPQLYELLSLIDAIRVGRVREQRLASQELERRILTV
jgi:hypothetical protein